MRNKIRASRDYGSFSQSSPINIFISQLFFLKEPRLEPHDSFFGMHRLGAVARRPRLARPAPPRLVWPESLPSPSFPPLPIIILHVRTFEGFEYFGEFLHSACELVEAPLTLHHEETWGRGTKRR